jgi:hypothetical protein
MPENAPNRYQQDQPYDPDRPYYPGDPPQLWRWMQHRLYKQGIDASPDEAQKLFELQLVHDAKLYLQQDLAEHGIDVSPDEAYAIQKLRIIHLMMQHTGTTDPHDAIERIVSDGPPKPYEPNE